MDNKNIQQQIDDLNVRVSVLEAIRIPVGTNKPVPSQQDHNKPRKSEYSGTKGGILLLKEEGFLKIKKTTDEVRAALDNKGYVYSRDVVQTALNRLSKVNGPLVKIEEKGKKVYVERK